MSDAPAAPVGALAPLKVGIFRAIWLASIVSNIGGWMQTVGAQWFLVEQGSSATTIALVQAASAAPVLLLGIPAGVLGEFLDRRRLLIGVQAFQAVTGLVLAALTAWGQISPALLLLFTFLLGAGAAVQLPAYQALVPDIVPRPLIPSAAALSSIGINIARSIGPALAGLAIAGLGVAFVFALNAVSFAAFLVVLLVWRGYRPPPSHPEPFLDATRAGLRYVRHAGVVRRLCIQLAVFVVPGSALWAVLPLVASARLELDANGYGLLLAAVGVGSAAGAFVMGRARSAWGVSTTVMVGSAVYSVGVIGIVVSPWLPVTLGILVVIGVAWITVIALLNGTVQAFIPTWVRARGLSVYQIVFFGGTAAGSVLAGAVAQLFGLVSALVGAGALILVGAASLLVRPLLTTEDKGREIVPLPLLDLPVEPDVPIDATAETLVLVRYRVAPSNREELVEQLQLVGRSRRRTGARRWQVYDDREDPDTIVEAFTVGSWREHLDQHERRPTQYDDDVLRRAVELALAPPTVEHLTARRPAK
ncbi:MFS transporter [Schumannella luteola]